MEETQEPLFGPRPPQLGKRVKVRPITDRLGPKWGSRGPGLGRQDGPTTPTQTGSRNVRDEPGRLTDSSVGQEPAQGWGLLTYSWLHRSYQILRSLALVDPVRKSSVSLIGPVWVRLRCGLRTPSLRDRSRDRCGDVTVRRTRGDGALSTWFLPTVTRFGSNRSTCFVRIPPVSTGSRVPRGVRGTSTRPSRTVS